MSYELLPNRDKTQELETKAKIFFTTHGYIHAALNLQGVAQVLETFGNHLERHKGKKVLFWENADTSKESAKKFLTKVESQGLRKTLLEIILRKRRGRPPETIQINEHITKIERDANNDIKKILDQDLIPQEYIQNYFLLNGLDQLRAEHNFDIVLETHEPDVLRKSERLGEQRSDLTAIALANWNIGNFDTSISHIKKASSLENQDDQIREKDMGEQSKNIVPSLLLEEKGGLLFVLVGEAHLPLADTVMGSLDEQSPVQSQRNIGITENMQSGKILHGLRSGDIASDEIYMQDFIIRMVQRRLINDIIREGDVSILAKNYHSYLKMLCTVSAGISLEAGREICENRISLYSLFNEQSNQWRSQQTQVGITAIEKNCR